MRWVGWHHWLNGCEFVQTSGAGEGTGSVLQSHGWQSQTWPVANNDRSSGRRSWDGVRTGRAYYEIWSVEDEREWRRIGLLSFGVQLQTWPLLKESEEETEWDKESLRLQCRSDRKLWREVQSQGHPVDESYTGQNWPGLVPTAWVSREGQALECMVCWISGPLLLAAPALLRTAKGQASWGVSSWLPQATSIFNTNKVYFLDSVVIVNNINRKTRNTHSLHTPL